MDLGMFQRELAKLVGADNQSVRNWEADRTKPTPKHMPKLIAVLGIGIVPDNPSTLSERLKRYRLIHSLTQRKFAKLLGVSPDSIISWEKGRNAPTGRSVRVLKRLGL